MNVGQGLDFNGGSVKLPPPSIPRVYFKIVLSVGYLLSEKLKEDVLSHASTFFRNGT